jgi:Holliday junction resolvase
VDNYRRGARKEWDVMKDLEAEGYTVIRSAGSHSFCDVIAVDAALTRFIQIKVTKRKQRFLKLQQELATIPRPPQSTIELWVWLTGKGWYFRNRL